jgi:hypothetical protein
MTLMLIGAISTGAKAQEYFPAADPFAFDPDFHWFEPVYDLDLADMKAKKRAHHGWFATYDRLNLYTSRPELNDNQSSETLMDSAWGHRYEIGYMLPQEDKGWLFSFTEISGPNQAFLIEQERLNRINTDQLGTGGGGGGGAGAGVLDPSFPGDPRFSLPASDRNTPGYNRRVYFIGDTENVLDFDSYELSKTWRTEPYHYGGILEPMVGFRWMRVNDTNYFQNYRSSLTEILTFNEEERLTTTLSETENEVLTGQAGFRYTKFRDRFTFASDFRIFTGGSLQSSRSTQYTEQTIYDDGAPGATLPGDIPGVGDEPLLVVNTSTVPQYNRNEEFVIGFDIRGEINYQLTKMITVRGGFQVIDIATGIWRGGPGFSGLIGGDRDQDVVMFGGTFGVTLNR